MGTYRLGLLASAGAWGLLDVPDLNASSGERVRLYETCSSQSGAYALWTYRRSFRVSAYDMGFDGNHLISVGFDV